MKVINHLELGHFLRKRYNDLVSADYRREELLVRSTDRDRTLLSARANLKAFYNTSTYDAVPIHTVPVLGTGVEKNIYAHF